MLPACIMTLLVAYSLSQGHILTYPYAIPEAAALVGTIGMHILFRSTMGSILVGLGIYMAMLRFI